MGLVAFDFDGTLSDDEMIVRLGEQAGCRDEIAAITERAMAGELSYGESLRERVGLLAGLDESAADLAMAGVELRPGAEKLLAELSAAGERTAVLTGGFEAGVEAALDRAGVSVDRVVANRLVVVDGQLTGAVEGPLIERTKDDLLVAVADAFGIDLAAVVAVGDGANDRPMLDAAGTAIGFRPKPGVAAHCDATVDTITELRTMLAERGFGNSTG